MSITLEKGAENASIGAGISLGLGTASMIQALLTEFTEMPQMMIMGVDALSGQEVLPAMPFQFYPETLSDSIEINYTSKSAPGTSASLMEWSNNGGRTLTFEARFIREMEVQAVQDKVTIVPIAKAMPDSPMVGSPYRNWGIQKVLHYLRAYCLPTYESDGGWTKVNPPPVAMITMPGVHLGGGGENGGEEVFIGVMTTCDVVYNKIMPGLATKSGVKSTIKDVTVSLAFKEVAQIAGRPGDFSFPDRQNLLDRANNLTAAKHGSIPAVRSE